MQQRCNRLELKSSTWDTNSGVQFLSNAMDQQLRSMRTLDQPLVLTNNVTPEVGDRAPNTRRSVPCDVIGERRHLASASIP